MGRDAHAVIDEARAAGVYVFGGGIDEDVLPGLVSAELTHALWRAFPAFPPFRGEFPSVVPHLTVAHGSAAVAETVAQELAIRLARGSPIRARCSAVALIENAAGRWTPVHRFPLASRPACTRVA